MQKPNPSTHQHKQAQLLEALSTTLHNSQFKESQIITLMNVVEYFPTNTESIKSTQNLKGNPLPSHHQQTHIADDGFQGNGARTA